jgi:hypothetical protein
VAHTLAPLVAYVPGMHTPQSTAPMFASYVPALQLVQTVAPLLAE